MTKPTKWLCAERRLRSAWASTQSDQSSLSAWRNHMKKPHSEDWSDWADAQADLSLRWAHSHFVVFFHVVAHVMIILSLMNKAGARYVSQIRLVFMRSQVRSSGPAPSFVEIWSWNHFSGNSLPTADSSRPVVSYWQKYGHSVLVNRLGSLPRKQCG